MAETFGEMDQITLFNPTAADFTWGFNGATYRLKANTMRVFPGGVAELGVKHLVDQLIISDNKTLRMNDVMVRSEYAEKIVKRIEHLAEPEGKEAIAYNEGFEAEVGGEPVDLDEPTPMNLDDLPKDEDIYKAPTKDTDAPEEEFPGLKDEVPGSEGTDSTEGADNKVTYQDFVKANSKDMSMKQIGEAWQALKISK